MKFLLFLGLLAVFSVQAMPGGDSLPEEENVANSREKRYAGMGEEEGDGDGDKKGKGGLDVDVNVNVNAPQQQMLNADIDVDVNINAGGGGGGIGGPTSDGQYDLCPICGTRYDDKIVGGQDAVPGDWPWMVSLSISTQYYGVVGCGGAIISRDTILTAAHCLDEDDMGDIYSITAIAGAIDATSLDADSYYTENFIVHSEYNSMTYENDIAIIKLNDLMNFTRFVRPVCLGTADMIEEGRQIVSAGWGVLEYGGGYTPDILQEVTLDIISTETCQELYPVFLIEDKVCTLTEDKDACQGDSGGPMVVEEDERWFTLGVVSFGEGCAFPDKPNVATGVPYFKDWILNNIGDINC